MPWLHPGPFPCPKHRIDLLRGEVERLQTFMQGCAKGELLGLTAAWRAFAARLEEMNPRRVLQRGYAYGKTAPGLCGQRPGSAPGAPMPS